MIGAGLFNNIAPTAKISSYGSILGLLLASTLAIANASSSAQLSSLFPKTGGTYLYNEIGRNKTSHELRETFWGKFSQVTDSKPGAIPVCLLKNY